VRVREERLKRGITQEQLAQRAELDRSYVGQVERGERNVSLDNIYRLANAPSIEADSLV
jgi:transcriptional regulator with XRE-family HTH domain